MARYIDVELIISESEKELKILEMSKRCPECGAKMDGRK